MEKLRVAECRLQISDCCGLPIFVVTGMTRRGRRDGAALHIGVIPLDSRSFFQLSAELAMFEIIFSRDTGHAGYKESGFYSAIRNPHSAINRDSIAMCYAGTY